MTVATGAIENRRDLRRHLRPGINCLRFIDRRIGARWSNRLDTEDQDNQKDRCTSQNSLHGPIIYTNETIPGSRPRCLRVYWYCVRDSSWFALRRINKNQTTKSHEPGITKKT